MSITAQKQDISDPHVIHRFATQVADRERLDYLYLLTCADIAGTSPKLWNAWKERLLADLRTSTRLALRQGVEHPVAAIEHIAETRAAVRRRSEEHTSELQSLMRISYAVFCLKKKKKNIPTIRPPNA